MGQNELATLILIENLGLASNIQWYKQSDINLAILHDVGF